MPELPEVETIRLGLEKYLVGDTILDLDVRLPRMVSGEIQSVKGAKVQSIRRYGKGLVIDLDNDYSIAIHIKMTGQLVYKGVKVPEETKVSEKVGGELPNKHTHVIFKLKTEDLKLKIKAESFLYYNDIRQFGWMKVLKTENLKQLPFFRDLGPEPFRDLTIQNFFAILQKTRMPIKPLLLDQKRIAGVGNIYANDALFLAKIHPKRPANSLKEDEVIKLLAAIETVLKKGLEVGGASEWQYVNVLGQTGGYQNFFKVYGKVGKPCVVCGTTIQKIEMGGRGTFFCPHCQE